MRRLTAPADCHETIDHHAFPTAIVAPGGLWQPFLSSCQLPGLFLQTDLSVLTVYS